MNVSIILPMYNPHRGWCDELIQNTGAVENAIGHFAAVTYILVNDGSLPETVAPADIQKLKKSVPNLHYIERTKNQGKGYSVREGMSAADDSTYYIYTDFDFPFGAQSIFDTIKTLESGVDVVAGRRNDSYLEALQCCKRYCLTHTVRMINRSLLNLNGHDAQAGLKGFNSRGHAVFLKTTINSFLFDTEFLAMVKCCRLNLADVEVTLADGIAMSKKRMRVLVREGLHLTFLFWRSFFKFNYALKGIHEEIRDSMFSPTVWWNGSNLNRSGAEVQMLQIYSYGVRPCNVLSRLAK